MTMGLEEGGEGSSGRKGDLEMSGDQYMQAYSSQ